MIRANDLLIRRVNIVDFDSPISLAELPGVEMLPRIRVIDPTGRVVLERSGTPDVLTEALDVAMVERNQTADPESPR